MLCTVLHQEQIHSTVLSITILGGVPVRHTAELQKSPFRQPSTAIWYCAEAQKAGVNSGAQRNCQSLQFPCKPALQSAEGAAALLLTTVWTTNDYLTLEACI